MHHQASSYDTYAVTSSESRPHHFNKLLLILMISSVPALALLYASTKLQVHIFFVGAVWLNLLLLGSAGIVVVISGIMGFLEERKFQKLAHPNTHPRPHRYKI